MKKTLLLFSLLLVISTTQSQTSGTLNVTVTTAATGMGYYEPSNILAIWLVDNTGKFVKTLLQYGYVRTEYLDLWNVVSAGNTVDAKTGATQTGHGTRTCTWNGKNAAGTVVADGTYKIRMQLTDDDFSGLNATFSFTKGSAAQSLTPANASPCFNNISIQWTPTNTAIEKVSDSNQYSVYPNPTMATAYVSGFGIKEIELYSLAGKYIFNTTEPKINLNNLAHGVYIARIHTALGTFNKKIEKL
jgi:Predicted periplasmic protein (DUF2271).